MMCWKNKILAILVSGVLSVMALAGCAGREGETVESEVHKGRYVETEILLPEECSEGEIRQILRLDGELHLLLQEKEEDNSRLQEWMLEEDGTFVNVTKEWLADVNLPYMPYIDLKLMQDGDGVQYLYGCYPEEEEDSYRGHLWRREGERAVDITPEKWTVKDAEYGFYDYPSDIAVLGAGSLVSYSYMTTDVIGAEDGSIANATENFEYYGDWITVVNDKIYRYITDDMGMAASVEICSQGLEMLDSISFSQEQAGNVCFDVLEDGAIIAADTDGFFRCEKDDTNWKRVINGTDTSFGLSDIWCQQLVALPDGSFYVLFGSEEGTRLMQYRYDADAVIEVTETLTLYTIEESFLLQQAAVLYHKEHPEVVINIEKAFSKMESYTAEPDYEQIYQELNTRLMASKGPDILILDGLNIDAYASKGLLVDIDALVTALEEEGSLLENVTGSYVTEAGKRYAVPLQFGMMFAVGRDMAEQDMVSMEVLADALASKTESYMGSQSVPDLVDKFYYFFTNEILQDKRINREGLSLRLEQLKKIWDNCSMAEGKSKDERSYNIWDIAYGCKLAFYETEGFNGAMLPFSAAELVNGNVTCFEQSFFPKYEIAVNSKSEYTETAMDFVRFALSPAVQSTDYYEGFPVNRGALELLAGKDRTGAEAYTTIKIGEDMYEEFAIKSFSEEKAQLLVDMCKKVSVRAVEDVQIRKVLIEVLPEYLDGVKSLEDTLDEVEGGLRIYLVE